MNLKKKIIQSFRWIELIIRKLYYHDSKLHGFIKRHIDVNKINSPRKDSQQSAPWSSICQYIDSLGITEGDLLLVHTSAGGLKNLDKSPIEIIEYLKQLVGESGTLVLPAYPKLVKRDGAGRLIYDSRRSPCTTGLIPQLFSKMEGTIRSRCPLNSLAATGKKSWEMMVDNLKTDLSFGPGSAWAYCIDHDVKVLFFGVPIFHSNTITHVVEDMLDEEWPISDWYDSEEFVIIDNGEKIIKKFRIRKQFWARYTTQYWNTNLYRKNKLLYENIVEGIPIGFIPNGNNLVMFLRDRAINNKLPFVVPRKFWKKSND